MAFCWNEWCCCFLSECSYVNWNAFRTVVTSWINCVPLQSKCNDVVSVVPDSRLPAWTIFGLSWCLTFSSHPRFSLWSLPNNVTLASSFRCVCLSEWLWVWGRGVTAVHNFHRFGILAVYIKTAEYISQIHRKMSYTIHWLDPICILPCRWHERLLMRCSSALYNILSFLHLNAWWPLYALTCTASSCFFHVLIWNLKGTVCPQMKIQSFCTTTCW